MHQGKNLGKGTPTYAVSGDFCRVFLEEMNRLYLLSFLFTGDHGKAEQCLVSGFEDCLATSHVFKEWTLSWARRAVIQNAIRIMQPFRGQAKQSSRVHLNMNSMALFAADAPLAGVLALSPFERFVYVLSVLERYSDQECKILLECTRQEVVQARNRALEQVAGFREPALLIALPSTGTTFAQAGC